MHFANARSGVHALQVSVLHQACAARPHPQAAVLDVVKLCTALGAPVSQAPPPSPSCPGQRL
jgi:hypothetical protein